MAAVGRATGLRLVECQGVAGAKATAGMARAGSGMDLVTARSQNLMRAAPDHFSHW